MRDDVLFDFWYGSEMPFGVVHLSDLVKDRFGANFQQRAFKFWLTRALLFWWFSRKFRLAAPNWPQYGRTVSVLQALVGPRNLVLLECIDFANLHKRTVRTTILSFLIRLVFGPAMRRSVLAMQTMSDWEKQRFSSVYGIPLDRIHVIHWPLFYDRVKVAPDQTKCRPYVFSSGRSSCDWETLYKAALQSNWTLHIVCTEKDAAKIIAMNKDQRRVTVSWDVPEDRHNSLMAEATVTVICLEERNTSAGQIRLGTSIALGVPVVASRIRGLEGYLHEGITALGVPVGNPAALATAVDELFYDEARARSQANAATDFSKTLTSADYFAKIAKLFRLRRKRKNYSCSVNRLL